MVNLDMFQNIATQVIATQVSHAIGAEVVISTECKEVVRDYVEMILRSSEA